MPDRLQLQRRREGCPQPSRHDASNHFRHYTRGRYALGEAYRLTGVGREGALLAPAYHCVTMLDPAMALDAEVELYPLHADLSPNLEALDELLASCDKPVKALLATHFFGFPQDFSALKKWCDRNHVTLIEDCSHVLFTESFQATGTGVYGRFVAASPYKFFPCDDGGLLYSTAPPLLDAVKTISASPLHELRGIKHMIGRWRSGSPLATDFDSVDRHLLALRMNCPPTGDEQIIERSRPSTQYSDTMAHSASLRSSRLLVSHSSIADNITERRNNFWRWAQALANLPNCHALFPELPQDCAPYMFPLYIDYPTPHFYWLKHLGVPVWRWDEMAVSNCSIAADYRLHLIHLPCHQALTNVQMNWMIATLQKTLQHATPGAQ